jgi:hypothetical protein
MTAFAAAIAAIFADRNIGEAAVWRAGGTGAPVPVRVVRRRADRIASWNDGRFATDSDILEVSTAEVAALAAGDTFEIGAALFEVAAEPLRDAQRLVWTAQVRAL